MKGHIIHANQVVRRKSDDQEFRVLWVSGDALPSWWIALSKKGNTPQKFDPDAVESGIIDGTFELAPDLWYPKVSEESLNPKWKSRRDRAWTIIQGIVSKEPDVYDRNKRTVLLQETAGKYNVSFNNLYKYLGKYWKHGMVPNALLPDYGNVGKVRDVYKESSRKGGRPKREGAPGKKLTLEDVQHFSAGIRKYYLTGDRNSLKDSYEYMIRDWYSIKENGKEPEILPPDELPSFAQFSYWYNRNRDILKETRKRDGERAFSLNHRAITAKTEDTVYGPGAVSQIDSTIADIYLVSQTDRQMIVGRPTMYFVMDAASHIVTGMYITLKPASWESAAMAIRNGAQDKVSFCARYGINITEDEWPCHHLPQALVADRGEVESTKADVLANSLGIQIVNTPPYRGDLKGIIEQHFRLINLSIPNSTPGKVQPDFGKRGGKDYRLDAVLDLHQFTAIIIRCVLHYNNHHYMKEFTKTMQMRQLGVKPVPLELWNYGIRHLSGGLRTTNEAVVNYALLPRDTASITERGIYFRQMYYTCPEAEEGDWFALARTKGTEKISVSYDPNDMDVLYIRPDTAKDPLACHLVEHNRMYKGLDEAEVAKLMDADTAEAAAFATEELDSAVKLKAFISDTGKEASDMKKLSPGSLSKTQKLSSIDENRKKEIEAERHWQTQKSLEGRGRTAADIVKSRSQDPSDAAITRMIANEFHKLLKKEGGSNGSPPGTNGTS